MSEETEIQKLRKENRILKNNESVLKFLVTLVDLVVTGVIIIALDCIMRLATTGLSAAESTTVDPAVSLMLRIWLVGGPMIAMYILLSFLLRLLDRYQDEISRFQDMLNKSRESEHASKTVTIGGREISREEMDTALLAMLEEHKHGR